MEGGLVKSVKKLSTASNTNMKIVGSHDFNKDINKDILWRDEGSGNNYIWLINNTTPYQTVYQLPGVTDLNFKVATTGDFNGDKKGEYCLATCYQWKQRNLVYEWSCTFIKQPGSWGG